MDKIFVILLLSFPLVCAFGQVGIGTSMPDADLHVNGSMLVTEEFQAGAVSSVNGTDEDFKLVTRVTNSVPEGEITILNVNALSVAPINVVNYEFKDLSSDNLTDLDLGYDATKYIVGISNFQYIGSPVIKHVVTNNPKSIGTFVMRTFKDAVTNTWHIEIRNRFLDTATTGVVSYKVTLIIYDRSYFKNLAPITTNLGGSNTGTASSVPNLVN